MLSCLGQLEQSMFAYHRVLSEHVYTFVYFSPPSIRTRVYLERNHDIITMKHSNENHGFSTYKAKT